MIPHTLIFIFSMLHAGATYTVSIPFTSESACLNAKEEIPKGYGAYGLTNEPVHIISMMCVDQKWGVVK